MKSTTVEELKKLRRKNLESACNEAGNSRIEIAERYPCDPSYITNLINEAKPIGESVARKLESALKKPFGWLDIDHLQSKEPESLYSTKKHYPIVLGTARCGEDGYYMELEGGDGYLEIDAVQGSLAIRIKGHSMHPAIRENWFVIVEPNKPPTVGEYALAKFKNGKKMVKEVLQIRSDGYLLLSVNGGERITALFDELEEDLQAVTAIVPPSKHKEFQP